MKKLRVAIVHDILLEDGGAERVLLSFSRIFPQADIYTSFISEESKTYQKLKSRIKRFVSFPAFFTKFLPFVKPFLFSYWESMNFDKYDLVISSTHSFFSKAVMTKPATVHICYCHTPPRFLYGYETESKFFGKFPFSSFLLSSLRQSDYISAQRPDFFIANSKEVQNRIKKFYGRDSTVIFPPVIISKYKKVKHLDYYVIVSRLARPKRVDLAIQACNILKRKLIIIGDGSEKQRLEKLAGDTIQFLGNLNDQERDEIVRCAKGFIFCSENEDFGIAPVEALGLGVPVIAYYSGGPIEIIKENKNGKFFNELSAESLEHCIHHFEKIKFDYQYCHESSLRFSEKVFSSQILRNIKNSVAIL